MFQTIDSHWQSQITMLCYQVSQWDREFWHDYLQAFPHVQDNLKRGERQIKGWSLFAEEIFHRLFTLPQAIAYEQLRPEVLWAHELHQLIEQSVDFSEMQLVCRNDKQAAGMGTDRLLELALEALPKPPKGFQSPTTVAAWEQQHVEIKAQTVAVKKTLDTLQTQLKTELDPQRQTELQRQMEQMSFDLEQLKRQLRQIGRQLGRARQVAEAYAEALGDALGDVLTDALQKALFTVQTFLAVRRSPALYLYSGERRDERRVTKGAFFDQCRRRERRIAPEGTHYAAGLRYIASTTSTIRLRLAD